MVASHCVVWLFVVDQCREKCGRCSGVSFSSYAGTYVQSCGGWQSCVGTVSLRDVARKKFVEAFGFCGRLQLNLDIFLSIFRLFFKQTDSFGGGLNPETPTQIRPWKTIIRFWLMLCHFSSLLHLHSFPEQVSYSFNRPCARYMQNISTVEIMHHCNFSANHWFNFWLLIPF